MENNTDTITHGGLEQRGWVELDTNYYSKDGLHLWKWDYWTLQIPPKLGYELPKKIADNIYTFEQLHNAINNHYNGK